MVHRLRSFLGSIVVLGTVVLALGQGVHAHPEPHSITFTSWVGPYMRSQMLGFVLPYEEFGYESLVTPIIVLVTVLLMAYGVAKTLGEDFRDLECLNR